MHWTPITGYWSQRLLTQGMDMSLAIVYARAQFGISSPLVRVEIHLSNGLPAFNIVGLPETAVKESKDRVRSALLNSYFEFPQRRITVNLSPADLPKEGGRFDLPIALGILAASEQIPKDSLKNLEFVGELALCGELREIKGCLCAAMATGKNKRALILPAANETEASLCKSTDIYLASTLLEVCAHLHGRCTLPSPKQKVAPTVIHKKDLNEIKGQLQARRALEIAACGGHNILFYGPPGTGKSMLASRLPSILPELEENEALESAAIKSITSETLSDSWLSRPFRSPHHTASAVALVGGSSPPKPGEISLAHNGVLFLDELPEFSRHVLEVLREPMESGHICISRASAQVNYPANFQLVAAMNPCPCGFYGEDSDRCNCSSAQVKRYRDKISGPLLDRIDLHVKVDSLTVEEIQSKSPGEASEIVRQRVSEIRMQQITRQKACNAQLDGKEISSYCQLTNSEKSLLAHAMRKLNLSARSYDRILKVARTIADMEKSENIQCTHISEALTYRNFDRQQL